MISASGRSIHCAATLCDSIRVWLIGGWASVEDGLDGRVDADGECVIQYLAIEGQVHVDDRRPFQALSHTDDRSQLGNAGDEPGERVGRNGDDHSVPRDLSAICKTHPAHASVSRQHSLDVRVDFGSAIAGFQIPAGGIEDVA